MLRADQVGIKRFLVKDRNPRIVLNDFVARRKRKVLVHPPPFGMPLQAGHPVGMLVRELGAAADFEPVIQVQPGSGNSFRSGDIVLYRLLVDATNVQDDSAISIRFQRRDPFRRFRLRAPPLPAAADSSPLLFLVPSPPFAVGT